MHRPAAFTLIELLLVVAIVAVLAAIVFPALAAAKRSALGAVDISNLRQIGAARLLYADSEGESVYSVTPLVKAGIAAKVVVASPADTHPDGLANCWRRESNTKLEEGEQIEAVTDYKDSYVSLRNDFGDIVLQRSLTAKGGGWLVGLSLSSPKHPFSPLPCRRTLTGIYHRLLFDGSVVIRHHFSWQNYPTGTSVDYQNHAWYFSDEPMRYEPGWSE